MKNKHSAGDWSVVPDGSGGYYVESLDLDEPLSICSVSNCGKATLPNAELLAMAPKLLAFVQMIAYGGAESFDFEAIESEANDILASF